MSAAPLPGIDPQIHQMCEAFRRDYRAVQAEIAKAIVGHEEIVDGVLTCLFVGGHCLLEGVPGLGKTLAARSFAQTLGLRFARAIAATWWRLRGSRQRRNARLAAHNAR